MRQIGITTLLGCLVLFAMMLMCGAFYPNAYIGQVWSATMSGVVTEASSAFYMIMGMVGAGAIALVVMDK